MEKTRRRGRQRGQHRGSTPGLGLGVYNITKAAVVFMTRQSSPVKSEGRFASTRVAPGLIKTRFAEALWGNEAILERC